MTKLVPTADPALRAKAKEISPASIKSVKIKKLIAGMKKALTKEDDGVAIAAPQVGESLRLFIVSKKVFDYQREKSANSKVDEKASAYKDMVFINPKITKRSKEYGLVEEGCLSVRFVYGKVKRAKKATITAQDETGKKFTMGGSGLLAQIFQHECDHLEGVLFIDKAVELEDLPPTPKK
ncbi:MAG: peptide deformylase [Patescibacteria group bacterium]